MGGGIGGGMGGASRLGFPAPALATASAVAA